MKKKKYAIGGEVINTIKPIKKKKYQTFILLQLNI